MKTHLLFSLTFQPSSVVWVKKPGGGNPSTSSLSLLVFGSKIAFSAGKGPWEQEAPAVFGEQEAPAVFGVLWCSRSHNSH